MHGMALSSRLALSQIRLRADASTLVKQGLSCSLTTGLPPVPPWDGRGVALATLLGTAHGAAMTGGFQGFGLFAGLALLALAASPAMAANGISISEPTDLSLIALAVAGLLIGRRNGRRPPEK